jgi:fatty-acyl-CoA synthase
VSTPAATVAALLDVRARDDTLGLVVDEQRWTWREVVEESDRWAAGLVGLRRSDRPCHVGLLMGNRPEYLFALFAAARVGAVVVGINDTRRGEELARDIRHADCAVVLCDAPHAPLLADLDLGGATVLVVSDAGWRDLIAAPVPGPPAVVTVRPEDLYILIFTSGSTGAPKAVKMSQGRAALAATSSTWSTGADVLYCAMPLFHGNALNAIVFPALASGAAIALRDRFSASQFMPDVRRYHATFFSTVGRALAHILATAPGPEDRDHCVKFALAPEASARDMRVFRERFGIHCISGYGSSENAIIMVPAPGLPKHALGVPQEGLDIIVVDPETGDERAPARFDEGGKLLNGAEAIGEIVGRNVVDRFEGYYNNPEAEAERTRNGWYWSGDLGYRDENHVFYFAGRTGEWLRVDSENFATAPVERILERAPGFNGVAVYPVPDERTADDQVMVAIEMEGDAVFDADGFGRFLAEQPDLGTKWAPRYVRITALPVGATNKVDKRPLRAERWYIAVSRPTTSPRSKRDFASTAAPTRSAGRERALRRGRLLGRGHLSARRLLHDPGRPPGTRRPSRIRVRRARRRALRRHSRDQS